MEEQYYLIWPLALLLLPRRWIVPSLGIAIVVNVAGGAGILAQVGINAVEIGLLHIALPTATYAPILMGSLLAIMLNAPRGFAMLYTICGTQYSAALWMLAVLLSLQFLPLDLNGWPNLVLHSFMVLALASLVIREDNALRPALTFTPIRHVGRVSYGIYLYHLIALHFANKGLGMLGISGGWAVLLLYAVLSVFVADLSFRFFESYFLAMRHRMKTED